MAMACLGAWFARKISGRQGRIREPRSLSYEYRKALGARSVYAQVTLSLEPATEFSYESHATWPANEHAEDYEHAVQDGVIEELLTQGMQAITGVRVVLESIGFHPVDSSPNAFYQATRAAVRSMLASDGSESTIARGTVPSAEGPAVAEELPETIVEMRKILNRPGIVPERIYRRNVVEHPILSYANHVSACLESRNWQAAMLFVSRAAEELLRVRDYAKRNSQELNAYLDLLERYLREVANILIRRGLRDSFNTIPSDWIRPENRPAT